MRLLKEQRNKYALNLYFFEKKISHGENKKRVMSKLYNSFLAGLPGFEPRMTGPESVVLPLHHSPMSFCLTVQRYNFFQTCKCCGLFFLKKSRSGKFCIVSSSDSFVKKGCSLLRTPFCIVINMSYSLFVSGFSHLSSQAKKVRCHKMPF